MAKDLNLSIEDICEMKRDKLEEKVRKWDSEQWKINMEPKKTLEIYRELKPNPEEVKWFKNGYKYAIMMQARSNSLNLGWRGISEDRNKLCRICELNSIETLTHFLVLCPSLQSIRNKHLLLQRPHIQDIGKIVKILLLYEQVDQISQNELISILFEIWLRREKLE